MILTMIFLLGVLSLVHYLGLEGFLALGIGLPLHYYLGLLTFLIVLRVALALRKAYPYIKYLTRKIVRLAEIDGVVSPSTSKTRNSSGSQTKPGVKNPSQRSYSTLVGSGKRGRRAKADSSEYKFSYSKKVLDSFFRVISKEGSLVTLNLKEKIRFLGKDGKPSFSWKPLPYPSISALFKKVGFRIFGACFPLKGKYSSRLRQMSAFLVHILNMNRHHGPAYVVKYLKVSQLAIQKAIAGTPVSSLNQLDPSLPFMGLATCGLPKFIPIRDRKLMLANGSASVIRWWLTLFSVYRVIYVPGKLKLETITEPMSVSLDSVVSVGEEMMEIINPAMFDTSLFYRKAQLLFLESASSTTRVSWMGFIKDIVSLSGHDHLPLVVDFLRLSGNNTVAGFIIYIAKYLFTMKDTMPINGNLFQLLLRKDIGKLSLKKEAAGKVRVFAMVDVWTQSALRPLHDMLFAFLRSLPNDGTFDQNASVKRCMTKSMLTNKSFGYDLSAATDRLPLVIQSGIIDKILPGFGEVWAKLLVTRGYALNSKEFGVNDLLHYSVGQPMGALSSWAMLAVTHHYIAQLAAITSANLAGEKAGPFWISSPVDFATFRLPSVWYTGYEVLGDDIVFFEESVGREYLKLMDRLGVPINLSKSVVANNPTFEFAKVTGHRGHHVAAVSWAMFMAQPTIMGRAGIAFSLLQKGIVRSNPIRWLETFARQSKYSYGDGNAFYLALGTMFSRAGYMDYFSFLYSIMQKSAGYFNVYKTLLEKANLTIIKQAISAIVKTGEKVEVPNPLIKRRGWRLDEFELKQTVITTINTFVHGSNIDGKYIPALDPMKDAMLLAKAILSMPHMLLGITSEGAQTILAHKKVFNLRKGALANMDQREAFLHHVFCYLFVIFYDKLSILSVQLDQKCTDDMHGLELSELMDCLDIIDRYKEVLRLPDRAVEKLSNKAIPKRNLIESPLAVLQQLMSAFDPFGPSSTGPTPSIEGSLTLQSYLYALERVENFSEYLGTQIGDDVVSYLKQYYRPLGLSSSVKVR